MTLMLDLNAELEMRLRQEAARAGVPEAQFALKTLEERLSRHINTAAIALLDSWDEEDATDDPAELEARRREWEEFKTALNENRPPDRKLFP